MNRLLGAYVAIAAALVSHPAGATVASCYGTETGSRTATGARFNPNGLTAAHRTLPFGTRVRISYRGRSVVVRINDRGPFIRGREFDLSLGACRAIGLSLGQVDAEIH